MPTVELSDASPSDSVGIKAANLGRLIRAGFAVPAGVVLPASLEEAALPAAVAQVLDSLRGDRFAVRSSGVAEDMPGASFAGQYETRLGVARHEVLEAVRSCRESGHAARVAAYRDKHGLGNTAEGIAVIVQELVDAVAAGVAFSSDPLTGAHDRVVVSAVRGLGERLVSGHAAADVWWIEAGQATCRARPEAAIDADIALRVAAQARAAADHFRSPQDIEWAVDREGRLLVLQSRPITALPQEVRWEAPGSRPYRRNLRLGEWFFEPLTPLFDDWLVNRLETREHQIWHRIGGFHLADRYHALVNGWYFKDVSFIPSNPLALLAMMLRTGLPRAMRHPRRWASMLPPVSAFAVRPHLEEFHRRVQPAHRRLVDDSAQRMEAADAQELVGIVDRLADDAGEYFVYLALVGGFAWKSEVKLARFCRANLAGSGLGSHQELMLACREPAPEAPAVVSLDWYRPPLAETVANESISDAEARHARLLARREKAESLANVALVGRRRLLRRFGALLAVAREFAAIREEQVSEFTLGWPILRRALDRLGQDLVSRKVLSDPDEIYFLTRDEVLKPAKDLSATARSRWAAWMRQRRLTPPLKLGPEHEMVRRILDDNIETFRGFGQIGGEELLRGMPSSPGVARGRVHVIAGPEAFEEFQSGEVLVAQATTPGWTPLFARAAAVVTDAGSVMAHASLVAREYGIPAVVGTGEATQRLEDGMLVTVDGSAGVVLRAR